MAVVSGGSSATASVDSTRGLRIDGFLQRDPGDLVPISQPTEAFLSYDATNFYVVFVCRTSEPSQLRARMARRESMFSDDFVAVILDTFDDHQRGYEFFSNPLGIQADGITTEGQNDDMSFDTVWQSKGRLTDFGYVVSFAIPFKSLRFPSARGPGVGHRADARHPGQQRAGVLAGRHTHDRQLRVAVRGRARADGCISRTQHPIDSVRHVHRRALPGREHVR